MINLLDNIPRLYTAIAEWSACTIYVIALRKKVKGWKLIVIPVIWLLIQSLLLDTTGNAPIVFWVPIMILAVGFMFSYLYSTCNISFADIGFCCAKAFVLAEFVAALEWQIYCFFINQGMARDIWVSNLFCIITYALVFPVDFWLETRKLPKDKGLGVKKSELFNAVLIASIIFLFSNLSFININTPFSASNMSEIFYIRTLVDLCGVLFLYAQQDERQKRELAHEMEAMNNILNTQYKQYQMSRSNIEILDQKYHDLKHQIIAIRQETDLNKREHYLTEMEDRIQMYESEFRTGNHVLDILLTMKSAYCSLYKINFTCVADGSLIGFMDTVDICSIFGNALDNAIESVEKLEDVEKRLIRTAVYAKDQLVMIRFENYCEVTPVMEDGLPNTTKKNKVYHGYGLKSINMITQKYGGTMTIKTENNWFILRILIPRRTEKKIKILVNTNKKQNS